MYFIFRIKGAQRITAFWSFSVCKITHLTPERGSVTATMSSVIFLWVNTIFLVFFFLNYPFKDIYTSDFKHTFEKICLYIFLHCCLSSCFSYSDSDFHFATQHFVIQIAKLSYACFKLGISTMRMVYLIHPSPELD